MYSDEKILNLLSLTMVTPKMLVQGGLIYNPNNKLKSNLRKAQKTLQQLCSKGFLDWKEYFVPSTSRYQKFYYQKFCENAHHIGEGLVNHDTLTALFSVHLFRLAGENDFTLRWHPPLTRFGKKSDGEISVMNGSIRKLFLILESDTGSHKDRAEIEEKITAYIAPLSAHPECRIFFLASSMKRKKKLKPIICEKLQEIGALPLLEKIYVVCPEQIPPNGKIGGRIRRH